MLILCIVVVCYHGLSIYMPLLKLWIRNRQTDSADVDVYSQ